jgi:hypothetical protein
MALPVEPTPQQVEAIRRLIVVFSLWSARRPHGQLAGDPRLDAAADALALEAPEREALVDYEGSPERFSFFNRRAANWLFGQRLAAIVGHPGDWSVAAPAAAWAIHAIKAADEAVTTR